MFLVDTSVWIDVFRDSSGERAHQLRLVVEDGELFLTRFCQLELLGGCLDEREWSLLKAYLEVQDYLDAQPETWESAARIYFELRRKGLTVRSPIDCCIAQLALENDLELLHRDRDFVVIAEMRPLRHRWLDWV